VPQIRERVGGLDVHGDSVVACTRTQMPKGQVEVGKERFTTAQEGLADLTGLSRTDSAELSSRRPLRYAQSFGCGSPGVTEIRLLPE